VVVSVRQYLESGWVKFGLALLLVGGSPLTFIVVTWNLGLWPDADPDLSSPSLLLFVMFWPALACILIGVICSRRKNRQHAR
jgi:hypothetical protein